MSKFPAAIFLRKHTPPHIFTLIVMTGIAALAMNIFLPSLPGMTEYFQTDYAVMQLSISAFLGVNGLLQLIIGPVSDRYGRRPIILGSFIIFLIATVGCILTSDVTVFLFFRMLQAVIVAAMVLGRAVIRDMVSADKAASMIGYVTMGMALVPMVGPIMGGLLDEWFGWKANFGMLLVAGIIIFAIVWADLGETNHHKPGSFAKQIKQYPQLFTSRRFWGYAFTAAFLSGSFFSLLGGAPIVAVNYFHLGPAELGAYFAITPTGYMIGNFLSGRYSTSFGINRMILTGSIITTLGMLCALLAFLGGATHPLAFFGFTISIGLGNGIALPNAMSGMLSVKPHLAGTASGLGGALMTGGGAAFAATTGSILAQNSTPIPLILMMLGAAIAAIISTLYVIKVFNTVADAA